MKVKQLIWSEISKPFRRKSVILWACHADSIFGSRTIHRVEHSKKPSLGYPLLAPFTPFYLYQGRGEKYLTLEAAKSAVQKYYEARILSALEPFDVGVLEGLKRVPEGWEPDSPQASEELGFNNAIDVVLAHIGDTE